MRTTDNTIEAAYFTGVATTLAAAGIPQLGIVFAILVAIHDALTHQRVIWRPGATSSAPG